MINWGIIGAGSIARVFANGLRFSKTGRLEAIASRTAGKADALADLFDVAKRYNSYEDILADSAIDAVYISTIHPAHLEPVVMAAKAGKHILVEKPIAMNAEEAAKMVDAARENDVFLMEAFMYRCHPQIAKMVELIQDGAIGDVLVVRSTFGYHAGFNPDSRAYNRELGGGGILDVGCYPASMVRLVAGAAAGKPFLDPVEFKATGVVGPTGVDHYTTATLKFENDVVAEIATAVACNLPPDTVIYGSEGILSVPNPWLPSSPCRSARTALPLDTPFPASTLLLHKRGAEPEEITVAVDRDLFSYEADMVGAHIDDRQAPAASWDDTLGNMRTLDAWLAELGVNYA
ncbi:MAG: Gfo/Idh/MocA family oxidoreductase [Caldilineaceae bacterium]|nr:Gfo/Idh/MocA family oxidoreductase [Caldilineaceae bacterium]